MNKLLLILSLSFMLAGEMEVDGDLNVSGDIQSPTIAQLQEIIAQLQEEIAALQAQINSMQNADNKLETRIFQTGTITDGDFINIYTDLNEEISELDFYLLEIVQINDLSLGGGEARIILKSSSYGGSQMVRAIYESNNFEYYPPFYPGGEPYKGLFTDPNLEVDINVGTSCNLLLAITAQFPTDGVINSKNNKEIK